MLGQLPKTAKIAGKTYQLRTDYRVVLRIIAAINDPELTDKDKVLVCLVNLYPDFTDIPNDALPEAYEQAVAFIEAGGSRDKAGPKLMDWEKDEAIIFPAINQSAGKEVRELEYLHWWTFLGYFQSIDKDSIFGTVLSIRQKKKKHKKLETWEQEFYHANRKMCDLITHDNNSAQSAEDSLKRIYEELLKGGDQNGD